MPYHLVVTDGGKKDGLVYGSFKVYDDKGHEVGHRQWIYGLGTSNQAEYRALIVALTWCLNHDIMSVVVIMDSKLIINQVLENWECRNVILKQLNLRAKELIESFESFNISYMPERYIKQKLGH